VLLAVVEYGEFLQMLRVADIVKVSLNCRTVIFFAKQSYRDLAEHSAAALAGGHLWMDCDGTTFETPAFLQGPEDTEPSAPSATVRNPSKVQTWWRAAAGDLRAFLRDLNRFRRRYREIASLIRRAKPALVVTGQDLIGQELSFVLRAARRATVPTLIVPFAMFALRGTAQFALARPEHHVHTRPLNRLVAMLFPHWVLEYEGHKILRLPGSRALALEIGGLIDRTPWVPCSEPVTTIACESRMALRKLKSLGVPERVLRVVGAPVYDRIAAALRHSSDGRLDLMRRHHLDPKRLLLLCGWPANIFAWLGGRRIHYADYSRLADTWARELARVSKSHDIEVLVTIHPKTLEAEWEPAKRHGLACQRGDTEDAIAHCDAFVTLNGSSITAWAIACRKPVLLFDCYRTGYDDFDNAPGCVMVHDEASFARELDRLCAEPDRRQILVEAQARVAEDWGELDGRSGERLAAVCAELIGRPS
jgi:hypothetical protein